MFKHTEASQLLSLALARVKTFVSGMFARHAQTMLAHSLDETKTSPRRCRDDTPTLVFTGEDVGGQGVQFNNATMFTNVLFDGGGKCVLNGFTKLTNVKSEQATRKHQALKHNKLPP